MCLPSRKSKDSFRLLPSVQSQTNSPGQCTNFWTCTVPQKVSPCVSVALVVCWLVLKWENTNATLRTYGGVRQQIYGQSSLQIICTYLHVTHLQFFCTYSGHISDSWGKPKQKKYYVTIGKVIKSITIWSIFNWIK